MRINLDAATTESLSSLPHSVPRQDAALHVGKDSMTKEKTYYLDTHLIKSENKR